MQDGSDVVPGDTAGDGNTQSPPTCWDGLRNPEARPASREPAPDKAAIDAEPGPDQPRREVVGQQVRDKWLWKGIRAYTADRSLINGAVRA